MQNEDCRNEIYKLLKSMEKKVHIPNLSQLIGNIKNGYVFVEARQDAVFIDEFHMDGKTDKWIGTYIAAANKLEMLGFDPDGIII